MNKKELMKLTKAELLELAKTNGRYVEESMSKAQIVEILLESAEPAEQAEEEHLTEQPEEQHPAEQPANEQSEENPAEQKSADEHSDEHSDETLHEENSASDQGDSASAETPTDKQPAETPSEEKPFEENPSDEHSDEQQVLRKKIAIAEELRRRQSRVGAGITKFAGSMQQVMKQEIANRAMKYGGVKSKILSSDDRKEALRKERDLRASRNK